MSTSRRKFIKNSLKATVITTIGAPGISKAAASFSSAPNPAVSKTEIQKAAGISFSQIALPYSYSALEPIIDTTTMDIHYNKHHSAYIKNVNDAIVAEKIDIGTEKDFFANCSKLSLKARNNGGGAWNHNFFWQVMTPAKDGLPAGKVNEAINGTFGSFENLKNSSHKPQ